jgi:hypothetical protein
MNSERVKKITRSTFISALSVGTLFAGKRYYDNWKLMCFINESKLELNHRVNNGFTIDRSNDREYNDQELAVGNNKSLSYELDKIADLK